MVSHCAVLALTPPMTQRQIIVSLISAADAAVVAAVVAATVAALVVADALVAARVAAEVAAAGALVAAGDAAGAQDSTSIAHSASTRVVKNFIAITLSFLNEEMGNET